MEKAHEMMNARSGQVETHSCVIQDWLFTFVPLGVAFSFYVVFIMATNIEPKGLFLAGGAAAGFVGLQSYWVFRGFCKKRPFIIVAGLVGIAVTIGLLMLYMS
jgi:tetrahydromethanopterin S-methyltransferase subunit D